MVGIVVSHQYCTHMVYKTYGWHIAFIMAEKLMT